MGNFKDSVVLRIAETGHADHLDLDTLPPLNRHSVRFVIVLGAILPSLDVDIRELLCTIQPNRCNVLSFAVRKHSLLFGDRAQITRPHNAGPVRCRTLRGQRRIHPEKTE